jgi:molybdate transport system substrate-binding protein
MGWLAEHGGEGMLGVTQATEILPNTGVTYAGPLPPEFQMKTVYSVGVAVRAAEPAVAREFVARFATPRTRELLAEAGYEP